MDIREQLTKRILLCDGAMGTMLQNAGIGPDIPAETINFTHPEIVREIHRQYVEAGADIICTNTFPVNSWRLKGFNYSVEQAITQAVALARSAGAGTVALDLAPIGRMLRPIGDLDFEEAVQSYKEQVRAGLSAGVDLILFETYTDLHELKAAVIAARELTDLPVFCSVTFEENGRMLTGADPLTVVNSLQDLGIDALGVNCSLGPQQMLPLVRQFLKYSKLPVLVQPNAGLPVEVDGRVEYRTNSAEFCRSMTEMVQAGASVIGGCCGTTPEFIRELAAMLSSSEGQKVCLPTPRLTAASSGSRTVVLDERVVVIGERLNPTGKKKLREALLAGDFAYVEDEALAQVRAGAHILDVNVGVPGIDEIDMMRRVVERLTAITDVPLQIDSSEPEVLEIGARLCRGRPILNSVNGKEDSLRQVLPIVKKYGCNVIALTLDDQGIPEDVERRIEIAGKIIKAAEKMGIHRDRIVVDCLTMTAATEPTAPSDTIQALNSIKQIYGVRTCLGASNVSFGLPERKLLNRTFLTMALTAGLDAPITDPTVPEYMETIRSYEALAGKDQGAQDYINAFTGKTQESSDSSAAVEPAEASKANSEGAAARLHKYIRQGFGDRAIPVTRDLLQDYRPLEIVENIVIPALAEVGLDYERGICFLPELVRSADTVNAAFTVLKEEMARSGEVLNYGKIVMATVKGDIHDIGKNIVCAILENYGYEVIDLGKDVPPEKIVQTVREKKIRLVGLSALMTTTVANMALTIQELKAAGLDCQIMVGGAVLDAEYARRIEADYYCKDAMASVKVAQTVFKKEAVG
ncbi:MAG TPA: dihydropteroate synthase [Clostridiales bacterium]|nr:dihydropteroate synthase [Clostridiales bacterium]